MGLKLNRAALQRVDLQTVDNNSYDIKELDSLIEQFKELAKQINPNIRDKDLILHMIESCNDYTVFAVDVNKPSNIMKACKLIDYLKDYNVMDVIERVCDDYIIIDNNELILPGTKYNKARLEIGVHKLIVGTFGEMPYNAVIKPCGIGNGKETLGDIEIYRRQIISEDCNDDYVEIQIL